MRASVALRTSAGRVRFAVAPPKWRRRRILDVLDPASAPLVADACAAARHDDYLTAHRALAAHLHTRPSRWPLKAARRAILATDVNAAFPAAAREARESADRVMDGRVDVLGYRGIPVGHPPRWDRDEIHNRTAPSSYWADVPYLDPAAGDHKVIWEVNRHQHFLVLGAAHWLTNDARYRTAFIRQLEDWVQHNPPLAGINWASMLELAFRTISWTWAVEFLAPGANDDEEPWLVDLFVSLDRQLTHIADNLSIYFSPNTHLSGESLALYAVSLAFPELKRSAARVTRGRDVLLREADRQVRGDGGHVEQSPHYHRYSTDFYLLACMMARAADDSAAPVFERTAHRQAAYLRTIANDDGRLPLIGDDDGGRLFRFDTRPSWDATSTLSAAAALLSDPSLAVRPPDAEVCWILGERPDVSLGERIVAWPSHLLADTGYFVSRSGPHHLVFDAGPHGFMNGGHAHSDALSV
ncbi:MAG TPA: heparinase II/III family protein, partial [Vicinamibacterales bacterium]|nr:heparinase II/III family protein [Vicinamibacterales bacterium]